jgi:hypothetical protein
MSQYDLERKINDKADKYQFHNLEGEISRLKSKNESFVSQVGHLESRLRNQHEAIVNLVQFLIENEIGDENTLYQIKNYL